MSRVSSWHTRYTWEYECITNPWLICDFVMSIHKPFIATSPGVFVKRKCCAWTWSSWGQVSCCARSTTTLDLLNFFLRLGRDWSLQLQDDHVNYYQCQLQLYKVTTLQRLYYVFVVWTERNLQMRASLQMTHSCKLSFHKLKIFSNYALCQNLYEGTSSLLECMVVKYRVMLLINLKWGKIVQCAWFRASGSNGGVVGPTN